MHVPLMFSVFVFWQPDAKILNIKKHMPDAKLPEHLELSRLRYLQHGRESNSWKHRKILCKHISNKEHEKKRCDKQKKTPKNQICFLTHVWKNLEKTGVIRVEGLVVHDQEAESNNSWLGAQVLTAKLHGGWRVVSPRKVWFLELPTGCPAPIVVHVEGMPRIYNIYPPGRGKVLLNLICIYKYI